MKFFILQTLFTKIKDQNIKALRQSTDDLALIGYHALAEELLEISDISAVFIGTSSGTTAEALANYFHSLPYFSARLLFLRTHYIQCLILWFPHVLLSFAPTFYLNSLIRRH